MDIVARVCTAYAWQRALGHNTVRDPFCCLVWDRAHPDVWDANHISEVRACTAADIDQVLQWADETFGHCRHRLFVVDPLTPAAFVARLALDDYRELTPTIQLVLEGPLRAHPRDLDLRPVTTEADWQCLYTLVRHNHTEGEPTHGGALPVAVTRGMVASYRQKAPAYQFFLARRDGVDCAYGAGVLCANGLGMVEDLFTLPTFRKRHRYGHYCPGDHACAPAGRRPDPHWGARDRTAKTALRRARLRACLYHPRVHQAHRPRRSRQLSGLALLPSALEEIAT
jgi:hypothetical protein